MDALGQVRHGVRRTDRRGRPAGLHADGKAVTDFVTSNRELLGQVALPLFIGSITTAVIGLGVAIAGVLGPWTLLVGALVAGGIAIYQNWDKVIKACFDETMPGFLPALEQAGTGIAACAKRRRPRSPPVSRPAASAAASRQSGHFQKHRHGRRHRVGGQHVQRKINWGDVGNKAAAVMWAGIKALFNSQVIARPIHPRPVRRDRLEQARPRYPERHRVDVRQRQRPAGPARNLNWQQDGSESDVPDHAMVAYFKAVVAIDAWPSSSSQRSAARSPAPTGARSPSLSCTTSRL